MRSIAPATSLIDLNFQGHPEYIACYVLETSTGLALIDPGPTSTLPRLEEALRLAGLSLAGVTDILLTHIHLDHAGAAGTIVRGNPGIRVHVHARGAVHMASPERLIASATRLYGDQMDALWGEFAAVPKEQIHALEGGETLDLGGRSLEVAYTPGHASHHVSYFDSASGTAFVGDTLGIRIDGRAYVMPVTPPPDIHLGMWAASHDLIRAWEPRVLCPTHFGPARPAMAHIDEHEQRLRQWALRVRDDLRGEDDDEQSASRFEQEFVREIRGQLGAEAATYTAGGGLRDSWHGLARYIRKHADDIESETKLS